MTIDEIIRYVLLFLPGVVAVRLYRSFCPERTGNDIFEIANITFQSVLILSLYSVYSKINITYLITNNSIALSQVFTILSISVLWSFLLIIFKRFRLIIGTKFTFLKIIRPQTISVWECLNSELTSDWAIVYCEDETIYRGYISKANNDPDCENPDFLLSDASCVDDDLNQKYSINGKGVYIRLNNVKRIEFLK
jgi:hypothetical protein